MPKVSSAHRRTRHVRSRHLIELKHSSSNICIHRTTVDRLEFLSQQPKLDIQFSTAFSKQKRELWRRGPISRTSLGFRLSWEPGPGLHTLDAGTDGSKQRLSRKNRIHLVLSRVSKIKKRWLYIGRWPFLTISTPDPENLESQRIMVNGNIHFISAHDTACDPEIRAGWDLYNFQTYSSFTSPKKPGRRSR